jgi:hypothetical protein
VAEEAVPCAPVSSNRFHHNREVYREFRKFGLFGSNSWQQSISKSNDLQMRFPIRPNREFAFTFQGIHRAGSTTDREFSSRPAAGDSRDGLQQIFDP